MDNKLFDELESNLKKAVHIARPGAARHRKPYMWWSHQHKSKQYDVKLVCHKPLLHARST